MPRNYGRFTTTIYRDDDFRALTLEQQGAYYLLGLQAEVTAAGTLPLTLRRWANAAEGMTPDRLADLLKILEDRGHVLIDEDTEELLIVKFVKWDGGIGNEKRRPVIREAALAVGSTRIRHRIGHEIGKLGYADMASELLGNAAPDAQSGFDRVVVKQGEYIPQPATLIPSPQPATSEREPHPPAASDGPPSMFCSKHPEGTEKPCGPCATARARYAQHVKDTADREAQTRRARAEAIAACTECDEHGRLLEPDTGRPLGRHRHRIAP